MHWDVMLAPLIWQSEIGSVTGAIALPLHQIFGFEASELKAVFETAIDSDPRDPQRIYH